MAYSVWHNSGGHTKQSTPRRSPPLSLARVLPSLMTVGRVAGGARAATVIVTALLAPVSNPIWWRHIDAPPPAAWSYMFECFTDDDAGDEWALAAAIFIAQTRRRTALGPTFAELFTYLLPEFNGLPGPFPVGLDFMERRRAVASFRGHVTIDWCRRRSNFERFRRSKSERLRAV